LNQFFSIFYAIAAIAASSAALGAPPNAKALVKDADRARGTLAEGAKWHVRLENNEGTEITTQEYDVKVLGTDVIAEATFPPKNKSDTLLFNAQKLWFFKPGLKKPVAFSKRQRLSGIASNGDIAASNYVQDYTAKLTGEDKTLSEPTWVIELTAKTEDATYDRIRYWITKKKHLGIQALILSAQGKPLKKITVKYDNMIKTAKGEIPFMSKMVIEDVTFPDKKSTMFYETPVAAKLSPAIFNINNLSR
jgi:hypothetical protein